MKVSNAKLFLDVQNWVETLISRKKWFWKIVLLRNFYISALSDQGTMQPPSQLPPPGRGRGRGSKRGGGVTQHQQPSVAANAAPPAPSASGGRGRGRGRGRGLKTASAAVKFHIFVFFDFWFADEVATKFFKSAASCSFWGLSAQLA